MHKAAHERIAADIPFFSRPLKRTQSSIRPRPHR